MTPNIANVNINSARLKPRGRRGRKGGRREGNILWLLGGFVGNLAQWLRGDKKTNRRLRVRRLGSKVSSVVGKRAAHLIDLPHTAFEDEVDGLYRYPVAERDAQSHRRRDTGQLAVGLRSLDAAHRRRARLKADETVGHAAAPGAAGLIVPTTLLDVEA
jgi:hypothetical protein